MENAEKLTYKLMCLKGVYRLRATVLYSFCPVKGSLDSLLKHFFVRGEAEDEIEFVVEIKWEYYVL